VDGLVFDGLDADDLARQLDRLAEEPGLLECLQGGVAPPRSFSQYIDELEAYYAGERPSRASTDEPAPPAVRWVGEHGHAVSLSIINGQVGSRLPGPVQRVQRDGSPAAGDPPLPHVADVEVRHQWPPDLRPAPGGRLAVIQPWEFGAIPADWVGPLRENVDELWVPSEYVRRMYLAAGVDERRVVTIPNGVDLERFAPDGPRLELADAPGTRFLFVGGLIWRKGHDVLLAAWREAFAGRDDVTLVVKGVGAAGVYRNGDHDEMRAYAASGELPRVLLIEDELGDDELPSLYRACDVLVHPYRGEGFAMPVLEAMACGLPVIVTDGGPTDEFCPPDAGWRIRSERAAFPSDRVDALATVGRPWVLEPDAGHLVELLREAAADPPARRRRGAVAREAARPYGWDAVAARYAGRVAELAREVPLLAGAAAPEPLALSGEYALRILATPAWLGEDRLGELLARWTAHTGRADGACLYLLADPTVDGSPEQLEQRVLSASRSAGADLDAGADIDVIMEPLRGDRDARLHAAVDAYVPLHAACAGHRRLAAAAGNALLSLDDESLPQALARATGIARVA
jgi:glycosyltransferase involved in cell wall biosynthesis